VTNAALRYKPSAELLAQFGAAATPASGTAAGTPSPAATSGAGSGGMRARRDQGGRSASRAGTLYFLDAKGTLQVARVRTGLSDGFSTEVQGQQVSEGLRVIDGLASSNASAAQAPAANPMAGAQQGGGGRGRGGGF